MKVLPTGKENLMKFVEVFKRFYRLHLKLRNGRYNDKFEDDFYAVLELLYWCGFYQPNPTKKRIVYGIFMFICLPLSYTLGGIKDAYKSYKTGRFLKLMLNVYSTSVGLSILTQFINLTFKRSRVVEMIKKLQSMHSSDNEEAMDVLRKKYLFFLKLYRSYLHFVLAAFMLAKVFGLNYFILIFPSFYDIWASGNLYYILLIFNSVCAQFFLFSFLACDLMQILCMVRVDANLKFLGDKLRRCTDGENLQENERKLIACVKYHSIIIG